MQRFQQRDGLRAALRSQYLSFCIASCCYSHCTVSHSRALVICCWPLSSHKIFLLCYSHRLCSRAYGHEWHRQIRKHSLEITQMQTSSAPSQKNHGMLALFLFMLLFPALLAFFFWPIPQLHGSNWVVVGFIAVCWSAWILMTFYVYYDAQKRSGNGLLWALFVFFGQVLGFLVYLIMRSAMPKLIMNGEKQCPQCRKSTRDDFTICPYCRTPLQTTCCNCKRAVQTDWQVCPYCREETAFAVTPHEI